MTTALDIITDALIEIGAHDLGQSVPAEDAQLGLRYLNRLLGRWSNSPGLFPVLPEISITMTGAAAYTIGPSGGVVANRPLRVDRATYISGGIEYPVNVVSRPEWDAINDKSATGSVVTHVWYDATLTNGTIRVYPLVPSGTLKLDAPSLLAIFAGLSTNLTLPEGYESALVLTLAVDLAGPFRAAVAPGLQARAAGAVRALKRMNAEPLLVEVQGAGEDFQIERGY